MSSIFTFDPDPPKSLSSPWPILPRGQHDSKLQGLNETGANGSTPLGQELADFGIKSLEPEPQEGSTEYKLHLLLRPRRSFAASSTVQRVSGSHLSKPRLSRPGSASTSLLPPQTPAASASSNQSKQSRLQNLTTQLLWRLQQSSPHHPASKSDLIIPALPDISDVFDKPINGSSMPATLLPGLGDSQGALYEIGVADDGTLVGLTNDELNESLTILRVMAFSLGCDVHLKHRIMVGDCQWFEDAQKPGKIAQNLHVEKLWVAEALVIPHLPSDRPRGPAAQDVSRIGNSVMLVSPFTSRKMQLDKPQRHQLRVSLTGSTTSGKSSLLGTLSTSTLDNGRGKSRLSLLKHRHEIASGVTSSVTGSLIGYHDVHSSMGTNASMVHVINYAADNISSWTDIHCAADPGRLVFLNDSAGHPRFRRTTVRSLISWAPHWTACCIAADSEEDTSGKPGATASARDILGSSSAEVDLATAHLDLCLKLGLPLIVVITKLDLASLSALKPMLAKILSALKSAGRRPEILSVPSDEQSILSQSIHQDDELEVIKLLSNVPEAEVYSIVPVVLTSAVTGKGIGKVHALLRHLPIPKSHLSPGDSSNSRTKPTTPSAVFHIDEIFATGNALTTTQQGTTTAGIDSILSGYLRCGALSIGQEVIVGPFSNSCSETDFVTHEVHRANSYPKIKGSPKANNSRLILPRALSGDYSPASQPDHEFLQHQHIWRKARIGSIRNLRLPSHELLSDQVGTVGLCPPCYADNAEFIPLSSRDRIRKGMVLMNTWDSSAVGSLHTYNGFVALVEVPESTIFQQGSSVIAYIASIRAPAKILQSKVIEHDTAPSEGLFDFEDGEAFASSTIAGQSQQIKVTFQFVTSREWFEIGAQVLAMPASGLGASNTGEKSDKSSAGLDGMVGTIIQGLT
ncbi:MAG: hypothetical protein L6R41_004178 [Letrouitia leprolyta]|nr:MAG: hypothetical protein L6R41_004178 [Letrouitia leprolyta]